MVAVGLVLPCLVTWGGVLCDTPVCHYGVIQYLPSACCRDSTGTSPYCLAFPFPLPIKERNGKWEIIQGPGQDSLSATLPLVSARSVMTGGRALDWLQPMVGEGLTALPTHLEGKGCRKRAWAHKAGRMRVVFLILILLRIILINSLLSNSFLAELHILEIYKLTPCTSGSILDWKYSKTLKNTFCEVLRQESFCSSHIFFYSFHWEICLKARLYSSL